MESAAVEDSEPIYTLALECERLYTRQTSKLKEAKRASDVAILSELNQRFSTWAAFLGVFAESKICLDRRLRHHAEIQEQVLRLLDIVEKNLAFVFEGEEISDPVESKTSDDPQRLCLNVDNLEGISEAIERLNHIGIAIRQSSVTSQTTKARQFAETFNFTSFEEAAYLAMKSMYGAASEELLQFLSRSMTETYALFCRRKARQDKLETPRARGQMLVPLSTISEELIPGTDAVDLDVSRFRDDSTTMIPRAQPQPRPIPRNMLRSEPTSMDSQEVNARMKKVMSPSIKGKAASILFSQAEYPRPAKDSRTCDWCFSPLQDDAFEGDKWQKHVNEDHRPYMCISEKCPESSPRFATSRQWFEHMLTTHGQSWHREVYAPSSWICPLCNDDDTIFSSPDELDTHLSDQHGKTFTVPQIQAVVRQSQIHSLRPRNVCPICCLSIEDPQDSSSKEKTHRKPHDVTKVDGSVKRLKTEAGYAKIDRQAGGDGNQVPKVQQQPEREAQVDPPQTKHLTVESIAGHVAGHLRTIMLLTLRLISIDVAIEVSADSQSASGGADHDPTRVGSGQKDLDQGSETTDNVSLNDDYFTILNNEPLPEGIPDTVEHCNWNNVPLGGKIPMEDEFLQNAILSGAFQSHIDKKTLLHIPAGSEKPSVKEKFNRVIKKSKELYVHDAIRDDESRMLLIQKGDEEDEVNAILLTIPDHRLGSDSYSYNALSYHWSHGEELKPIIIHQDFSAKPIRSVQEAIVSLTNLRGMGTKRLWVKQNLYEALKRLRRYDRDIPLWVDALCINQRDPNEKSVQVAKMNKIYRAAANVHVWLGSGDRLSWEAMEFIKEIIDLGTPEVLVNDIKYIPRWASFYHLLGWGWFSRRWVIQELALARTATVHCGRHTVHWNDFRDAIGIFTKHFPSLRHELFGPEIGMVASTAFKTSLPCVQRLVEISSNAFQRNSDGTFAATYSLESLVYALAEFGSSDPRDTINAVVGMCKESSIAETTSIFSFLYGDPTTAYTLDLYEVYRGFVNLVIESSMSLDVICRHWAQPERSTLNDFDLTATPRLVTLPSWILTVGKGRPLGVEAAFQRQTTGEIFVGQPGQKRYNASQGRTPRFEFGQFLPPTPSLASDSKAPVSYRDVMSLRVTGLLVGNITWRSFPISHGIIPELCLCSLGWPTENANEPQDPEGVPDQLWRTLVANRGPDGTDVPSYYRQACFDCMLGRVMEGGLDTNVVKPQQPSFVNEYLERVRWATGNRVVLQGIEPGSHESNTGMLVGLGPSNSQKGDVLAILYGCSVVVILRPHFTFAEGIDDLYPSWYEFVGEAYIHGKMDGEALSTDHIEREFVLR